MRYLNCFWSTFTKNDRADITNISPEKKFVIFAFVPITTIFGIIPNFSNI